MSELIPISDRSRVGGLFDVIFVHGLNGNAVDTWRSSNSTSDYWLHWLEADLPNVKVWSLSYDVSSTAWKGSTMPLADRAINILALLEAHDIGSRPVVFVTHSMGGLLVKQILRHASDYGSIGWRQIITQAKGIIFLATPHSGSDIASWLKHIESIYRSTVSVQELQINDSRLRDLNIWYRNNMHKLGLSTEVYYEKRDTNGFRVVNETSADPGIDGVFPIPMDDDHNTIAKPLSRNSLLYIRALRFLRKCISCETHTIDGTDPKASPPA